MKASMIAISDPWPFNHSASLAVPRTAVEKCINAFLIVRHLWFEVIYIMLILVNICTALKLHCIFRAPLATFWLALSNRLAQVFFNSYKSGSNEFITQLWNSTVISSNVSLTWIFDAYCMTSEDSFWNLSLP